MWDHQQQQTLYSFHLILDFGNFKGECVKNQQDDVKIDLLSK